MVAQRELEFRGIGVSPGIASGPVLLLKADEHPLPEYSIPAEDVPREMIRLEAALIETRRQLHDIQQRVGEVMGSESAGIFEAHLHVVDDPGFVDEVYRDVREKRKNVEKILFEVSERYAQTLLQMEDDYLRERATDIRDVTRRILRNLAGGGSDLLAGLETPRVLVSRDMTPSEMAAFDRRKILGMVTELGSPTSHAAIMARAMELPAIVGLRGVCDQLADGDRVILDGVRGLLVLHPSPARRGGVRPDRPAAGSIIQKRLATLKDEEAVTLDGHAVVLSANIEMPADVEAVRARGARGHRPVPQRISLSGGGGRTQRGTAVQGLCRGGPAGSCRSPSSSARWTWGATNWRPRARCRRNPIRFSGWRAIRLCLDRPAMFKTQLRAILRASAHNPEASHHVSDGQQRGRGGPGQRPAGGMQGRTGRRGTSPSIRTSRWA